MSSSLSRRSRVVAVLAMLLSSFLVSVALTTAGPASAAEPGVDGASLSGRVRLAADVPASSSRVVVVWLERLTPDGYESESSVTQAAADGTWSITAVEPGTYRLVTAVPEDPSIARSFYPGTVRSREAVDIVVASGDTRTGLDTVLETRGISVDRLAGADRFATGAAAVSSRFAFPTVDGVTPPVPVVYVANGQNFPDALGAGPAAAHLGGALLLTNRDDLPASTLAEITRLSPQRVVVVGGEAAVSRGVYERLSRLQPSIERIAGSDRYDTSRKIAANAFGDGADTVFVASGASYPDALAAGPAAAHLGGPVVLINGAAPAADAATVGLIESLGATEIAMAGGAAVVGTAVEDDLAARTGAYVERFAGDDRFGTTVALASVFPSTDTAFVATARGFADALVGGSVAALDDSPLYLSERDCVPQVVLDDIDAVGAVDAVLLGGSVSLSGSVESLTSCG